MISHHPSETTLASYATGALPEALSIVVAVHVRQCQACQRCLATLEATGGALLDDLAPVPLSRGALHDIMPRLNEPAADPPAVLHSHLPVPLDRVALGRWWPISVQARYRPLRVAGSAWGGLIYAPPGQSMPPHGHVGLELTCVLSGSIADHNGIYLAGDVSEPDADHDQPPVVVGAKPCLCVLASEGMRLRGLLGLAQRAWTGLPRDGIARG